MYLGDFAKNIYIKNTASANRQIKVVFADGRFFIATAKQLNYYCKNGLSEINNIKIGGSLNNYTVWCFNPVILTNKDSEMPKYNRSIEVKII